MHSFDVVIVGAGAAGLFCAGVAGQLGLKVLVLDHSEKVAEKIRISGGGRSNFTNMDVSAANFISENPRFAKSALSRYTPADFVALVKKHGIAFHEKHKGQLFCDRSAEDLIAMLLAECAAGGVERWQPCSVKNIRFSASSPHGNCASSYEIDSDRGTIHCAALVIATGGLSIPKIGATDFGYRLAQQFGIPLVERRPGLVPLTFDGAAWAPWAQLAGLALPVQISTGMQASPHAPPLRGSLPPEGAAFALGRPGGKRKAHMAFDEDLLFTHRGLSGPAVLQISSYWQEGQPLCINLAPTVDLPQALAQAKANLEIARQDLQTVIVNRGSLEAAVASAEAAVQLARIYAAIANGGTVRPLTILKTDNPPPGERVIAEHNADAMVEMLEAVTEKRGTFKSWTVLLAIAAFSLSLMGAFLVRSGVLVSVHSFATDPSRGLYLLVFLLLVVGGSLFLYALRMSAVRSQARYQLFSREVLLWGNNVFLLTATLVVFLGTLYPLFHKELGLGSISIGEPFFNQLFYQARLEP